MILVNSLEIYIGPLPSIALRPLLCSTESKGPLVLSDREIHSRPADAFLCKSMHLTPHPASKLQALQSQTLFNGELAVGSWQWAVGRTKVGSWQLAVGRKKVCSWQWGVGSGELAVIRLLCLLARLMLQTPTRTLAMPIVNGFE